MFCPLVVRVAALSFFAVVTACSTLPQDTPASVVKAPQHPVIPDARAPEVPFRASTPSASTAWKGLLAKAEQATNRGDYEQAMALLEGGVAAAGHDASVGRRLGGTAAPAGGAATTCCPGGSSAGGAATRRQLAASVGLYPIVTF